MYVCVCARVSCLYYVIKKILYYTFSVSSPIVSRLGVIIVIIIIIIIYR